MKRKLLKIEAGLMKEVHYGFINRTLIKIVARVIKTKLFKIEVGLLKEVYVNFVHSFITSISIAPLQGEYSEALLIPERLTRNVFR